MKRPNPIRKEKIVPFFKAKLETEEVAILYNEISANLTGERKISTFKVKGREVFCIKLKKPTLDDKMSELVFGLSRDAAEALAKALLDQLLH